MTAERVDAADRSLTESPGNRGKLKTQTVCENTSPAKEPFAGLPGHAEGYDLPRRNEVRLFVLA